MTKKIKNIFGIIFISLGILLNPVVLEKISSPQALIGFKYKLPVEMISVFFILIGVILIIIKFDSNAKRRLLDSYKIISIILFTTFIIFIVSNILCLACFGIKDLFFYRNFIVSKYKKPLDGLYPEHNKKEINQILAESWMRPYVYEPYTQFKERPFMGKYINVHEAGFREIKNQGPWPPDKKNINIFLFGGSTLFNYGLPDDETIASYLQENLQSSKLGKNVFVYNFGQGYYFSSQECILFKKLLTEDFIPNIAIFLDGLNEFYQLNDEPIYTEKLKNFFDRKIYLPLSDLPIFKLISNFKTNKSYEEIYSKSSIEKIITRYLINKKIIEAISKEFGVKSYFVWQPVPTYKYDLKYHLFADGGFGRHKNSKSGYEYVETLVKSGKFGNDFLWLAGIQEDRKKPLYVDKYHYTSELSKEIADKISTYLESY